ncbi:PhnD/SsuA/transferrin family substrate-binding protein [Lentilitoribacter sp. Alg239-R112]|jgi:phosphonate transport system substrate-binding protein|uniref:PhnD/SsuA/transferrin family substrate-binding protein n=1 Tax=Lentilitoribacter sp. Alg239-R112 TaxID=2305987 RepID=UPI001AED29C2|nr:PhnD/SsuA/transferrin family substrate-binding protein [Lentilitoribacter sp. Alg239-R112]
MFKLKRIHIFPMCMLFVFALIVGLSITKHAHASWKNELKILRIGVLHNHPIAENEKSIAEFSNFYTSQLGLEVEVIRFKSLGSLMDAHGSARVQYAIHSARSYATMDEICSCLHAIARPVSDKGSNGFRSVLVIRDEKKTDYANGKKLRIGFSRKNSMSGWVIPSRAIENGDIAESNFLELGSVEDVVSAYESGNIDGYFGWVPTSKLDKAVSSEKVFGEIYNSRLQATDASMVVWWSNIIHHGPHVVHRSLPDELTDELTDLLLNVNSRSPEVLDIIEPYFSGGFERANPGDYNAISTALNLSSISVPAIIDGKLRSTLR